MPWSGKDRHVRPTPGNNLIQVELRTSLAGMPGIQVGARSWAATLRGQICAPAYEHMDVIEVL